jgi:transposase
LMGRHGDHWSAPFQACASRCATTSSRSWVCRVRSSSTGVPVVIAALCGRCPEIAEACHLARGFATILRRRDGHRLGDWLTQADASQAKEIRTFANGLRKDLDAVTAGLTLPLNSGAVEGNVTRIKFLKRQHYGRAGFDLLRRRILLAH